MKFYTVTAHHQDNNKSFRITYPAMSCSHAEAKFLVDMAIEGCSVLIERANGEFENLSSWCPGLTKAVILDRCQAVF